MSKGQTLRAHTRPLFKLPSTWWGAHRSPGQCTKVHSHVCSPGKRPENASLGFLLWSRFRILILFSGNMGPPSRQLCTWNYINEWFADVFDKITTLTYFHSTLQSVFTFINALEATALWGWCHYQSCFIEISKLSGNYVTCQRHPVRMWQNHNLAP